ncbi:MAG: ArsB/NhaD family transporter [Solirubrobacterales bacterium]|nr:ArsB/NhaD family transporter [Solirubrobacterales bacterium]
MVLFVGEYNQDLAIEAVEFGTLGLLAGMMMLVFITQQTGVYDYIAVRAGQASGGSPFLLVVMLAATVAVLTGFLDNMSTILLVVPITFLLADTLDIDPLPLILMEILVANISGVGTLIGDPPNMMIGAATGLTFNDFLLNTFPGIVIILVAIVPSLYLLFRHRLRISDDRKSYVMQLDAAASITDRGELLRTMPVLVATILAFLLQELIHVEPATVALTGAAVALLMTRIPVDEILAKVEWTAIFFFMGLFVMVGALKATGVIEEIAGVLQDLTGGSRQAELVGILWSASLVGGLVDNVPLTATMIPVVEQIKGQAEDNAYWWALSFGAGFGGNLTLVSAAANVAASSLTEKSGRPIGFFTFLKVGLPVTLISTLIATGYILLRYG